MTRPADYARTPGAPRYTVGARDLAPADIGLSGWTFDPRMADTTATFAAGIEHLVRITLADPVPSLSRLIYGISAAGTAVTAGNVGLRRSDGELIATWPSQTANFGTTGRIIAVLGAALTNVAAGTYYVGIQFTGTTSPSLYRATQTTAINYGALTTGPYPNGDLGAGGDTTLPQSRTLSGMAANALPFWVGLAP